MTYPGEARAGPRRDLHLRHDQVGEIRRRGETGKLRERHEERSRSFELCRAGFAAGEMRFRLAELISFEKPIGKELDGWFRKMCL